MRYSPAACGKALSSTLPEMNTKPWMRLNYGYTVWCLLNITEPSHRICICVLNLQDGSYFARFGISTFKPKGSTFTIPFASVWKKWICSNTSSYSSLPVQVSIGQFNPRYKSHHELRNWNPWRCTSPDERRTAGSPSPQPTYWRFFKTLHHPWRCSVWVVSSLSLLQIQAASKFSLIHPFSLVARDPDDDVVAILAWNLSKNNNQSSQKNHPPEYQWRRDCTMALSPSQLYCSQLSIEAPLRLYRDILFNYGCSICELVLSRRTSTGNRLKKYA